MDKKQEQILKNQATIMMAIVDIHQSLKVEDLDSSIAIKNRMDETRDVLRGN